DHLMVFDQVKRKIWAIAYADLRDPQTDWQQAYQQACSRVRQMVEKLQLPLSGRDTVLEWSPQTTTQLNYSSNVTQAEFCANVEAAKAHIRAGDIFQVVLSQRLSTSYSGDPFALYRSLRLINPSPYMAYFHFQDWQIIGSSPEVMVKAEATDPDQPLLATVRPIAGTRPRGKTPQEDS
ncbi:MAG: chorismate-binding protein, partial [Nodosilinea sp.]